MRTCIVIVTLLVGLAGRGSATMGRVSFGSFDGNWEGNLEFVAGPGLSVPPEESSQTYRITIKGKHAEVFIPQKGVLTGVKRGQFQVAWLETNAVVLAIDTGRDDDGVWVETWAFVMTQKDQNTLITNFTRVVNNKDVPLTTPRSKFSIVAVGELKRTP